MPQNHTKHHRRSIRLKGYDYSQAGLYFITICCQDRICRFGHIENGEMILNELGMVAYNEWAKLPTRFPNFKLDVFQIMPNHVHGIIVLNEMSVEGAGLTPAPTTAPITPARHYAEIGTIDDRTTDIGTIDDRTTDNGTTDNGAIDDGATDYQLPDNRVTDIGARVNLAPTVSTIVGAYKSLVANECLKLFKMNNETMGKLWQRNYWEHIIRNEQSYWNISEYIINNPAKWNKDSLK